MSVINIIQACIFNFTKVQKYRESNSLQYLVNCSFLAAMYIDTIVFCPQLTFIVYGIVNL